MNAGYIIDWGEKSPLEIQTKDWINFQDAEGNPVDEDLLQSWAIFLNSPWSYSSEKYHIELNTKKDGFAVSLDFKQYPWRCYLEVVGYERCTGVIYGYGKSPEEALVQCISHNLYIQSRYNPKDESF